MTAEGELDYHTAEESHRGASAQRVNLKMAVDIDEEGNDKGVSLSCLFAENCDVYFFPTFLIDTRKYNTLQEPFPFRIEFNI